MMMSKSAAQGHPDQLKCAVVSVNKAEALHRSVHMEDEQVL